MSNVQNTEAQVSGLSENVRHNEKSIDLLRLDLKEHREETKQNFAQVYTDLKEFREETKQKFTQVDAGILANKEAIARLDTKFTVGFVLLAVLIVFQDQVSSLVALFSFAAK